MKTSHELPADLDNLIAGLRIENINLKLAGKQANDLFREYDQRGHSEGWWHKVKEFLASQQGEKCPQCGGSGKVSDSDGCGVWYIDCQSCAKKHPEQAEGAQGELKPCPFCGGQARLTHDDYVHEDLRPMLVVECTNCHTWVRAEAWNNRAALAQLPQANTVAVDRGALKMAINALRRDAEEGRIVRGEMADALEGKAQPSPAYACPSCADTGFVWSETGEQYCPNCPESKPSPAPELERPEVVAFLMKPDTYEPYVGLRRDGSCDCVEPLMTIAQHDRIVGALRAGNEYLRDVMCDLRDERDAAQARVAAYESEDRLSQDAFEALAKEAFGQVVDYDLRGNPITDYGVLLMGAYGPAIRRLVLLAAQRLSAPVAQAGRVPEGYMVLQTASLSHVLGLVEGAMEDAYGNAFQVCCGKGRGGECCGDPEAGWSPEDQRTMDVLNPIQRELRAMLAAEPAQGE